jgi:hypothetical protein
VCVHFSLSTPLLRRMQCELTSYIFSFDRVVFLCLQTPSKNISVLLFHVHVHTILKPLTMVSTLQLEIQLQTVLLVWLYGERRSNKYFLLLSILSVSHSFSVSVYRALKHSCRVHTNVHYTSLSILLGTALAQWLRYCATNRKVAGSIPDGVIGIFHWHKPSDRTMALGSTQPLTEMSTRSISWG